MARKPSSVTVEIPADEIQDAVEERARDLAMGINVEPNENDPDPDELRALGEISAGSDVQWSVYRLSEVGGRPAGYCGSLVTAELSMDRIAAKWGIGQYKVRGTRSNGHYAGQRTIKIAEAPLNAAPGAIVTPNGQTQMQTYFEMMDRREEKRSREMKEWAALLAPLFAPVIANVFGGNKGPTLADLTQTMVNMKELNGGGNSNKIDEMIKMFGLFNDLRGEDKSGSNWMDLVRDGLRDIGPAIVGMATAKAGVPIAAPVAPSVLAAPVAPISPHTKDDPMLVLLGWLKTQLAALAHQASLNKDPGLYAEVVLDNLPPGTDPQMLLNVLAKPDWWPTLVQFYPQVQAYPQWFAECREALVSGLTEMVQPKVPRQSAVPPMPADSDD